ncbi:MAG: hypothetical protein SFX73_02350 [Kofleriaceae bacterium]|nr:hypothetical protein [Kofleriaceae bacterium]
MLVLLAWVSKLELTIRLVVAVPSLGFAQAYVHASAAIDTATPKVPPEVLLSIAYVESRFDVTATSRIEGKVRRTGAYRSTSPPRNLTGTLYCGPLQTFAKDWDECLQMRDVGLAYRAGVDEMQRWMSDPRVRNDLTRALLGHGCGNRGIASGRCNRYPGRVLHFLRRLSGTARVRPPST